MEMDLSNTDVSLSVSRALRSLSKAGDQCRERTEKRDQEMPGFSMSQKSHLESTIALNNLQLCCSQGLSPSQKTDGGMGNRH